MTIWNIIRTFGTYILWPLGNSVAILPRFGIFFQEKSGNPASGHTKYNLRTYMYVRLFSLFFLFAHCGSLQLGLRLVITRTLSNKERPVSGSADGHLGTSGDVAQPSPHLHPEQKIVSSNARPSHCSSWICNLMWVQYLWKMNVKYFEKVLFWSKFVNSEKFLQTQTET
jgi:hypothetical protein